MRRHGQHKIVRIALPDGEVDGMAWRIIDGRFYGLHFKPIDGGPGITFVSCRQMQEAIQKAKELNVWVR